ncbi:Cyclin N-terminal [Trinorchestia longiramus]|nr:Cyclin N-terminal [Trinorchestia longiramus]
MPCWYYDKRELRHTPSIKAGLTLEQETLYRREGARFILQVGNKMGLRYETMATGVVFFHRFYMVHSFLEFPRHVTACCCLFLAGKVEETPKKCRDIMKTAKNLMKDDTWAEFGADPREEVMTLERIILQTIKFDFIVEHPYTYLLKYAKCLEGDKKKLQNMVQMAWTFVNDSLCTTLCLQWEAEIIAIALMYLAGKLSKFEVTDWVGRTPRHTRWWDMFTHGITTDLLEDICHQVLDLYAPNKADAGGDGKRSSSSAAAAARRAAASSSGSSSAATAAAAAAATAAGKQAPSEPQQSLQQSTSSTVSAADTSSSTIPAAGATVHPVPVIGTVSSSTTAVSKDEPDANVEPSPSASASAAPATPSSSYSQYGGASYPYSNFNPAYPPPPSTTPRYPYTSYPPSAPPPQTTPSTPLAPPPTHYPPPINPNSQSSHFSPYTTPVRPHPPYSTHPPSVSSYPAPPPSSNLPSHYNQTPPSAPYYPPANTSTSYLSGPSPYTNRHYPAGS